MVLVRAGDHPHPLTAREGRRHAEQVDELVEPCGRAAAREDHGMVVGPRPAEPRDGAPRRLAQSCRKRTAIGAFGVAVGVEGQNLVEDEFLDLAQRAP